MPDKWRAPSEEEARREADWHFLKKEERGNWKHCQDQGTPPWWKAGVEWVWTVAEAFANRLAVQERCFDHTFRPKVLKQIAFQARFVWDQKLNAYEHYRPTPLPDARKKFVDYVLRGLTVRLVRFDREILIVTADDLPRDPPPARAGTPLQRREKVDQFLKRVSSQTSRKITRQDFRRVAGYKARSEFQRWQRGAKQSGISAARNFARVLAMSVKEFVRALNKINRDRK